MNKTFFAALISGFLLLTPAGAADKLELRPDDHVALIGNTLADRMQHSGWLESLIHTRFPEHRLVFRNLGFSGDELTTRLRSDEFGSQDEWLQHEKADVIWAFFGFNESFQGAAGLAKFRKDLDTFLETTAKKNFSGKGTPRIVLFSPIAAEKHQDANMPDPGPLNAQMQPYVEAMAQSAREHNVQFVNLFRASQAAYTEAKESLTVNGIHLRDAGYQVLAPGMFRELFQESAPAMSGPAFEKLRAAVNGKNTEFFGRYRTVDGYNVYGGRSRLKFDGVMNRDTMQREMEIRDAMTANRDRKVWAAAQGRELVVKDDNLPPPVEVKSNKPGPNPDGTHKFLTGEEAIAHMKVPAGVKVTLFASEEQFPELANPVQMAFDTKGRLWVAVWPNYPERTPQSTKGDALMVFEDTNGDGKADKATTFIDDLNAPTGFQFYKDGVILVQAPDVWFVRDTDGDGKADWKERVLNGLDSADSHHTANALAIEPGGAIYLSDGVFHRTQVETAAGPVRNTDAAIYRFEPRTSKFQRYIAYGFANPHGRVFDAWGNDFVTDATGNNTYFGPAISSFIDYPAKHPGIKQFWERPSRPCPGTGMLSSRHFPEEFQENFLNCNVIGFQGIYRVKVSEEGSGLRGDTIETPLVVSDDPNFRPSAVDVAPDGSVYFLDWHNPIIGHMQHHLRDPSRDHTHGRIYRMTYEGRPLTKVAQVSGAPIPQLLDLLKAPENNVRTRAKIELGARPTDQVLAALQIWVRQFKANRLEDQHHLMEALWLHQSLNVVNEPLLKQLLQSPEPRARAQAVRVLCYWRDRVSQPLALLRVAAGDEAPRVRLEAVRAASFFEGLEAMDVAYESQKQPTDYYLDYVFKETTRQLQKSLKDQYLPRDPVVLTAVLGKLSDKALLSAPAVEPVLIARLERPGIEVNARNEALESLARLHKTNRVAEALSTLRRLDRADASIAAVRDLAGLLAVNPAELKPVRTDLVTLAEDAKTAPVRSAAYAVLVAADGSPAQVWTETARSTTARIGIIEGIILLPDPASRAAFQPFLVNALKHSQTPGVVRRAALQALPLMSADDAGTNFMLLATLLRENRASATAAQAMMQLPRSAWNRSEAGPVSQAILTWAREVPAAKRTEQNYVETVQLGLELAGMLPAEDALRVRKELLDLGVRVFSIKSVREQMRYDVTRMVVEAGKPFEIIFENVDMMPHNLVLVQPGAREEVGTQADKMQPTPDAKGRVYIPNNKKIIAHTRLLEQGQKETLKLTAPGKTGTYDYLCTFPEHWKIMFGELVVVDDMDAYLKSKAAQTPPPGAQAAQAPHQHQH